MQRDYNPERPADRSLRAGRPRERLQLRLLVVTLLFGWVPPFVLGRLRTQALRAAGVRIGRSSAFYGLPTLIGLGAIEKRLRVGSRCGFNCGCFFDLEDSITIGDHVSVGPDVMFLSKRSPTALGVDDGVPHQAPIVIGNGVWLGARCTVLPGVTIGAGSVIGAGVVVAKDVPEDTLLTGAQAISIARWRPA